MTKPTVNAVITSEELLNHWQGHRGLTRRVIEAFPTIAEKEGLNVKYIAAPKYLVTMDTKDPKKAEKQMQEKLTSIASQEKNVEMEFKIL